MEANVVDIVQPKTDDVATNIIDIDWEENGRSGSEVLSSLTSLSEWKDIQ